uniref:Uncharacterized protein n=1 Tax=Amazona collaria TaxID=241587 RepID=A0A8B9F2U9_9PSIT
MLLVGHVHGHEKGWRGDQDELQSPQTDMGDREEVVVADAVAARLLGVAGEGGLLVPPHALCCHHQHHYPEDEDDGEPDAPDGRGVAVHPAHPPPDHWLWGAYRSAHQDLCHRHHQDRWTPCCMPTLQGWYRASWLELGSGCSPARYLAVCVDLWG